MYNYVSWIEAVHVISVIMWMAGMLYLPRLYVYHAELRDVNSEGYNMLNLMERRLLRYIMNPAMMSSVVFGAMIAFLEEAYVHFWFHIKVLLVVVMCVMHMILAKHRKSFLRCENLRSPFYFKVLNESITLLIIVIVIMVIVKPFS